MPDMSLPAAHPLDAYVATPAGSGPWPGVVVLHEAFGLNDDIRAHADRIAREGYVAVAPNLYSDGGARRCLVATFRAVQTGRGRAIDDIETARTWTAAREDCTGTVGVIGFCMGGGFALVTARSGWDAAAPNYGILPGDLDGAMQGACPVVASYGGKDLALRGAAAKLEASLERAGVAHDVKEYPAAGHSFISQQSGPLGRVLRVAGLGHKPDEAHDAWTRIFAFFGEHLSTERRASSE